MHTITEFDTYQELAMRTSKDFGDKQKQLEYAIISLCGEAGEMANLLKKKVYHNKADITDANFIDEASDVLWYLACVADALGISLSDIATYNIAKLEKRYQKLSYDEGHYKPENSSQ
jgi:NTP pyrophosphatase (non-canonical NTP hydrolase)